jgi:hypothetical protein
MAAVLKTVRQPTQRSAARLQTESPSARIVGATSWQNPSKCFLKERIGKHDFSRSKKQ